MFQKIYNRSEKCLTITMPSSHALLCLVQVRYEGETVETLACMEEAIAGMEIELAPSSVVKSASSAKAPPEEIKRVTTKERKAKQSEASKIQGRFFGF
jgi:hypothetical protein